MEKEKEYFIPAISEEELKERNNIRNKRRVVGVYAGLCCSFLIYASAEVGLHINEIISTPLINNLSNIAFSILGTVSVIELVKNMSLLVDLTEEIREKNGKMREKINKYFSKEEETKTQRTVKYQPNEGKDYEQFLAILQIHNDLLKQKYDCLKQYKVKTYPDGLDYNIDSISTEKLYNQYKNYERKLIQEK